MPAEAGIQKTRGCWTPAFAGVTPLLADLQNILPSGNVLSVGFKKMVMPAQAGIQETQGSWTPAFAGVTPFVSRE
ncbi:MAG: hypothetical protein GVY13_15760 [Alphaproteobacteria bacterium]|jgi:hypothetical protein|nr:hypothetical protein [Alphaproteobacteria bacterium]